MWLAQDGEFRALELGTWLATPNGELTTAVTAALPPPYNHEAHLIAEAMTKAAATQRTEGVATAARNSLITVVVGSLVVAMTVAGRRAA